MGPIEGERASSNRLSRDMNVHVSSQSDCQGACLYIMAIESSLVRIGGEELEMNYGEEEESFNREMNYLIGMGGVSNLISLYFLVKFQIP